MDLSIALVLVQDGIVNGAIYGLLALALVIVFTVTRIILVPIGEFVAYGALTLAALETGAMPGTVWLLGGLALASAGMRLMAARRAGGRAGLGRDLLAILLPPLAVGGLTLWPFPWARRNSCACCWRC